MMAAKWRVFCWTALLVLNGNWAKESAATESVDSPKAQITVLYDAFGQPPICPRSASSIRRSADAQILGHGAA